MNNINNIKNDNDFDDNNEINIINNKVPEGPINLIEFRRNEFIINEKALNVLNTIKEDLIIVTIVGKAHIGKSSYEFIIINNYSSLPGSGFQISSSLNSCTKGIWLWKTPRASPLSPNTKIIFIV